MLVACCNGKILHCTTYMNYDDIYDDIEPLYSKLTKSSFSKNLKSLNNLNQKFIFILGPSLPCTDILFDSISSHTDNLELSDAENTNIQILPKNESTRVEIQTTQPELDSKINITYLLTKGHSVITGKFNTSPYLMPLLEIASFWKTFVQSKIRNCKHLDKILFDSQVYIQKTNFKKYFKKFPAIF